MPSRTSTGPSLLSLLLPRVADANLVGSRVPWLVFTLIALISTVRSCIHLLAPDGGAGSIAGMDLSTPGAGGIIFAFALWGSSQLVYAIIQLAVAFRYRSLVPAMYLVLFVETLLRIFVGHIKPVHFAHRPPGAVANDIFLLLCPLMLAITVYTARKAPSTPSHSLQ